MTVTQHQLLNYLLGRQGLLERRSPEIIPSVGALYSGDYTTPYLSLLARVQDFDWQHLGDHLYADLDIKNIISMQGNAHLIPNEWGQTVSCLYEMHEGDPVPEFDTFGISMDDALELRFLITEAIQQHGAQSAISLKQYLTEEQLHMVRDAKRQERLNVSLVLHWMWRLGLLDWGEGVFHWRTPDQGFILSATPPTDCDPTQQAEATIDLAHRYMQTYAPATQADWVWWSGLPEDQATTAFEALKPDLTEVEVTLQDIPTKLWILKDDLEALESSPDEVPEMVRLLPSDDHLLKAYKDTRQRFYDVEGLAEDIAFNRYDSAFPTIWIDGRIVGIWEWRRKANEPISIQPFTQPNKAFRKRLKPEIGRIQAFIEASQIVWAF